MKKILKLIITLLFPFAFSLFTSNAQSPDLMSYQAVIRDASGGLVRNKEINMVITILQGASNGNTVFSEQHETTTNENGLVSIVIGSGQQASTEIKLKASAPDDQATILSGDFSTINWAEGPYFIKVETDPTGGTDYTVTGTSQLMSVPYALHAKTASNTKFKNGTNENDAVYTQGDVGIGTSAPLGKLDVRTAGWPAPFVISHSSLGHTDIIQAGDGLLFKNSYGIGNRVAYGFRNGSDTHLMDIVSNGNVGIGTNNPVSRLHVANTVLNNGYAGVHTLTLTENHNEESKDGSFNGPFYGIGFRRLWNGGGATNIAGIYTFGSKGYRGGLVLRTNNNGVAGSNPNVSAIIIRPDGNVGIGVNNPKEKLSVNGKVKIGDYIMPDTDGNENDILVTDGSGNVAWKPGAGASSGGVGAGASMLTAYMVSKNMFAPHENNCGSDAFIPLFTGAPVGFCIEKNERSAAYWIDAVRTCLSIGKRLPELPEWQIACKKASSLGISNMTGDWEWATNFTQSEYLDLSIDGAFDSYVWVYGYLVGKDGCNNATYGVIMISKDNTATSKAYRCVH